MNGYTNEFHDIAGEEAFDLGADALHVRAPDEIMMLDEEYAQPAPEHVARARCVYSLVMAITHRVLSVREIRDRLAVVAAYKAPDLLEAELWHGRKDWQQVRAAMARCPEIEWECASGRLMVETLTAKGWSEREVGKRALCLVYAFVPDESVRPPIARSFATIGAAIGLTAENKRSAVSAAMQSLVLEMVHRAQRVSGRKGTGEFWFMKRQHCREALSVAMMGKQNRKKKETLRQGDGECRRCCVFKSQGLQVSKCGKEGDVMKRVRCQNAFVSEAVQRGMTITVRFRLAGSVYMEKTARIDFANHLVSLHAGWVDSKPFMEALPYGGEWFRQKNLREAKQTWDAGFNAAVRSGRQEAFLFIGNRRVNRFTGGYEDEVAEREHIWHWENICDAVSTLRVFIKNDPSPVWPKGSRQKGLWDEVMKQSASWHARRAVFFQQTIHPKLLGSLGYFADRYGDVPSFLVVGGSDDVSEYVRKQQRRLNHHCRKDSTRGELMQEIHHGEWPSVARRIAGTSSVTNQFWKSAVTKAIRRAVKAGVASTSGARRWFQKFHTISLLGGWARREEEARKQSTNKEA